MTRWIDLARRLSETHPSANSANSANSLEGWPNGSIGTIGRGVENENRPASPPSGKPNITLGIQLLDQELKCWPAAPRYLLAVLERRGLSREDARTLVERCWSGDVHSELEAAGLDAPVLIEQAGGWTGRDEGGNSDE